MDCLAARKPRPAYIRHRRKRCWRGECDRSSGDGWIVAGVYHVRIMVYLVRFCDLSRLHASSLSKPSETVVELLLLHRHDVVVRIAVNQLVKRIYSSFGWNLVHDQFD